MQGGCNSLKWSWPSRSGRWGKAVSGQNCALIVWEKQINNKSLITAATKEHYMDYMNHFCVLKNGNSHELPAIFRALDWSERYKDQRSVPFFPERKKPRSDVASETFLPFCHIHNSHTF